MRYKWTPEKLVELFQRRYVDGASLNELAEEYGLSRQRICQLIGPDNKGERYHYRPQHSIYPGVDNWIKKNRISFIRLTTILGIEPSAQNIARVRRKMHGESELRKKDIDKLIAVTGMTYEQLFGEVQNAEVEGA